MIYFVQCGCGCEAIKIGWSGAPVPAIRVSVLQSATPHPLKLLKVLDAGTRGHERWFHEHFASAHLTGEWFDKTILKEILALDTLPVMNDPEVKACPCFHTTPCHPRCTCIEPTSSVGCLCCCTHGSPEQQRAHAEFIQELIEKAGFG